MDPQLDEKKLVRQIDLRIIPFTFLLHMASYLDRVNIGHARLYGFEQSLNISSQQYAMSLSIFFVGYTLFEVPSNLMMKKLSPPRWIGTIMVLWGIATMATAAVTTYKELLIVRIFLGVFEAGFFPGVIHYLSFWYTRQEQGLRVAILTCASTLASAISGPVSYMLGNLEGRLNLKSWQWIFIVEGIPTVVLGILTWFLMPNSPTKATWLKSNDRALLQERLLNSHVDLETKFDFSQFKQAILDYKTYLYMICYLGFMCPMYSVALLMPTIVKNLGFSSTTTMLLTAPPFLAALTFNILLSWNSDRTLNRSYHTVAACAVGISGFVILLATNSVGARYFAMILVACGVCSASAPTLSWSNNNLIGATRAATASGLIIMTGNSGGIIAGQFYQDSEAPNYIRSHSLNLGFLVMSIVAALVLRICLIKENQKLELAKNSTFAKDDLENKLDQSSTASKTDFRYIL